MPRKVIYYSNNFVYFGAIKNLLINVVLTLFTSLTGRRRGHNSNTKIGATRRRGWGRRRGGGVLLTS